MRYRFCFCVGKEQTEKKKICHQFQKGLFNLRMRLMEGVRGASILGWMESWRNKQRERKTRERKGDPRVGPTLPQHAPIYCEIGVLSV